MKRIILFTIAFIAFAGISRADDKDEFKKKFNPIMTAVTSQSISPDARAGGMGDVGAATDPDVFSQAWNPAKYPFTIVEQVFLLITRLGYVDYFGHCFVRRSRLSAHRRLIRRSVALCAISRWVM